MKARVRTRVTINADPQKVFTFLSQTGYHKRWNPHMQKVEPEMQLALGSEYTAYSTVLGVRATSRNVVTKFIQDAELEIQNQTGMIKYRVSYLLETHGKGTLLRCDSVVSSDSNAFAFAKPIMEHLARRELNSDLRALKTLVETTE